MSLLLCRQEPVIYPYYIEELGIHICSSQELCYVIYNHPLLVMEDFVNERLADFLRTELQMPFLAERIVRWIAGHTNTDDMLFTILQECTYYSTQEQARFRQTVTNLRKMASNEYEKRRADYFYTISLYGRAVSMYERILEDGKSRSLPNEFKSKIWNNIASCYTKMFCYQKAMYAYDCAWNEKNDPAYLKNIYFLTLLEPELELKEKYRQMLEAEDTEIWAAEAKKILIEAGMAAPVTRVLQMFEKEPEQQLLKAAETVNQWKGQYRKRSM